MTVQLADRCSSRMASVCDDSCSRACCRICSRWMCDHRTMRSASTPSLLPSEVGDFADEVRRVFLELGRAFGAESLRRANARPPLDVYETDDAVEIAVDLPGVDAAAVRVVVKGDSVLIAGEKAPRGARAATRAFISSSAASAASRASSALARAVRRGDARAPRSPTASSASSLPKIADRRGRAIRDRPIAHGEHRSAIQPSCYDVVRILFIGDIVGRPGRELVRRGLAGARRPPSASTSSIANAENAAAGFGITREIGDQLLDWGVDVMTSGNHIWDKKEALDYIGAEPRLLRPANYPAGAPGNGSYLARDARRPRRSASSTSWAASSCCNIDDPFAVVLREIEALRAADAHHLRRLPRRGDVGEDRDGLAPRRQGHGRRRHAHARADRRRAHPAEGHRVPHRRRHDRAARFDHRRRDRAGARPLPDRRCRRGSRPRPAIRA